MNKIKSIAFDLGGVVVSKFGQELVENASQKLGIEKQELRQLMDKYEPDLVKGKIDHVTFWKKIISEKSLDIDESILKTLWMEPYEKFAVLDNEVIDFIKELKTKGYHVGCISNAQEPHNSYNRKRGLFDIFDICILSSEVGMRKPDEEIFKLYLNKTGFKPEEVVFIDDEEPLLANVKKVGMHPITFKNIFQLKNDLAGLGVDI